MWANSKKNQNTSYRSLFDSKRIVKFPRNIESNAIYKTHAWLKEN